MAADTQTWLRDLGFRAAGLALIALAATDVGLLSALAGPLPHHGPTLAELALAAIAFLAASGGVGLAVLGDHVRDEVDLPAKAYRRPRLGGLASPPR